MSEYKNFRITLHLTHFFQDHRSLCKIFVTKGMKNISDLQNHVQEIFKIKDFYFISHGHYIPPSEDIRVLCPDDIVIAVPIFCKGMAICATSTPMVNTLLKPKHKRSYLEDCKDISNCNSVEYSNMHLEKKKKKKKIEPVSTSMYENKEDKLYPNKEDSIHEHNIKIDIKKPKEKEYKKKSRSNIAANEASESEMIQNKQGFSDLPSLSLNNICPDDSNGSVKTKVLYFEKQALNDESLDKSKLLCNRINTTQNEFENQQPEARTTDSSQEENKKQGNSYNYIKDKKLFIRKRKSDVISYDLPKKSNIVRSILIPNTADVTMEPSKYNTTPDLWKDMEKSIQNIEEILKSPEKSSYQMKKHFGDVHQQININNGGSAKASLESSEIEITEVINDSNNLSKTVNTNIIDSKNLNLKEKCDLNKETENRHSASIEIDNIKKKNLEDKSVLADKYMDNDIVIHMKQLEQSVQNDSVINLNIPFLTNESSQKHVNNSLEKDSLMDDSCSSSTVCDNIKYDAVSFITKRKRKRSHRKRKSKLSVDNNQVSHVMQCDYNKHDTHFIVPPTVHIKFNDDGEPINSIEMQENNKEWPEKVTSKIIDNSIDIEQAPESDKISKLQNSLYDNKSLITTNMDHITINDTIELNDKISTSGTILSEDVILKSPVMTSTKPKTGDLIAFKMLRLTENYTPEVSKYIIGEILSYNEYTTNVDLKLIDGLDQCAEPGGKFSIGDSEKELYSKKSYCWTSLIEPRLIFP